MRGAGGRVAGGVLAAVICLTGCAPAPTSPPLPTPSPTANLLEARREAGIADCPVSDAAVPARPDGLPDITLDCIGGDARVRLAGLRGRPAVINVWAQWCEPCRQEAPYLREFAGEVGERVLMLGIDYADPRPDYAIEFARDSGWKYAHVVDEERVLAGPLRIAGPPQTFFVTADGRIAFRHVGAFTSTQQIRELARAHLAV